MSKHIQSYFNVSFIIQKYQDIADGIAWIEMYEGGAHMCHEAPGAFSESYKDKRTLASILYDGLLVRLVSAHVQC